MITIEGSTPISSQTSIDREVPRFLSRWGLLVISDLADGHDTLFQRKAGQPFHDALRQFLVVRLL